MLKVIAILLSTIYTYDIAFAQVLNKKIDQQINTETHLSETSTLTQQKMSTFHEKLNTQKIKAQDKIHILSKNKTEKNKPVKQQQDETTEQFRKLYKEQMIKSKKRHEEKQAKLKETTNSSNDEEPQSMNVLAF